MDSFAAKRLLILALIAAFGAVLALGGCASSDGTAARDDGAARAAYAEVTNRQGTTAEIFARGNAARVRLGTVDPGETDTLRIPPRLVSPPTELRFEIDLPTLSNIYTRTAFVGPGELVEVVVPVG
jgi:hypothetical protein